MVNFVLKGKTVKSVTNTMLELKGKTVMGLEVYENNT